MDELINENVFASDKKFVDLKGLDYFWAKAKEYVDGLNTAMNTRVVKLEAIDHNAYVAADKTVLASAKEYADGLASNYDAAGSAAQALVNAKSYADSLVMADGEAKFDTKGAAAKALADAKAYADGKDTAMDARVDALEAIDHKKLASDASAAAVATVLDGAPEKFDTLKEIAAWIAEADTAEDAASLVTRVSNLEAIDHDAYIAADVTVLSNAKSYADGLAVNYDAAGAAATAKSEAIAQAKLDAAEALKAYYKKTETYSKTEVNGLLSTNSEADKAYAKQYTDELFNSFKFAANSDIDALFAAKVN